MDKQLINIIQLIKIIVLIVLIGYFLNSFSKLISIYPTQDSTRLKHQINRFKPPFKFLTTLHQSVNPNQQQLLRFEHYYRFLLQKELYDKEIIEILALCYFYLNQPDLSIDLYQQALKFDPSFFWTHYNLALCFLAKENITEAKNQFELASHVDKESTIQHLYNSKTYLEYLYYIKSSQQIEESFQNAHNKTLEYIQQINLYQSISDSVQKESLLNRLIKDIRPAIF